MTPVHEREAAEQQTRWHEWQARNARSSRRSATQTRIAAVVVFAGIAVWLLMQLLASSRVA